eukprot:scaffold1042_cov401-Prasinococcus_capsulatus_cf.AAC.6
MTATPAPSPPRPPTTSSGVWHYPTSRQDPTRRQRVAGRRRCAQADRSLTALRTSIGRASASCSRPGNETPRSAAGASLARRRGCGCFLQLLRPLGGAARLLGGKG